MKSKPFSEHGADGGCPNNPSDQGLTPRCGPNSTIDAQTEIGALPAPVADRLRIAAEQYAHKSPEDQEHERRFMARDLAAYNALSES